MIQHTSPAATDSTRHQQLCNAIRMVHFHDRHCPRQGPFRQIYFPVTPKAEHLSPIRIGMRALRKLGKWPLKPKRVIGLSSYNSGVQNLSAKVGLYSSECSGLSVCLSVCLSVLHDKTSCLQIHRLHPDLFLCQCSSSSVVRIICTKGVPFFQEIQAIDRKLRGICNMLKNWPPC